MIKEHALQKAFIKENIARLTSNERSIVFINLLKDLIQEEKWTERIYHEMKKQLDDR